MKKVIIFGGTHGNEWSGVYAAKEFAAKLREEFCELELEFVVANPKAWEQNRRFVDEDLNRAFEFLNEKRPDSYEHQRAKEIKGLIEEEDCFVIDLHTTTSNMGSTLIVTREQEENFLIACEVTKALPDTKVIFAPDPGKKYLVSQSSFGMMIEVGPVANGVLNPTTLHQTLLALREILKGITRLDTLAGGNLVYFEETKNISYPVDRNGNLQAFIHEHFQDQDFVPLKGKYTPFKSFAGEDIELQAEEELYPIFINEAAYYPQKHAFTLCRKKQRLVSPY